MNKFDQHLMIYMDHEKYLEIMNEAAMFSVMLNTFFTAQLFLP